MEFIQYQVDDRIGVITLNRPDKANAQNTQMLDELDEAWSMAAADDDVRVIVLKANGKHFSSGHDIAASNDSVGTNGAKPKPTGTRWETKGIEGIYEWETKGYLQRTRRWRDVRKPSIAAVQGQCIAGGLMLCWPCDLIIAAENAKFSDPVVRMGIAGVEYHAHTWELGPRKAKELLFTARSITATEAEKLGMVNKVVPLENLVDETMSMASEIAQMHPFALAQAKRAVNQTMDIMGFYTALQAVFDIHELGHANALSTGGYPILVNLDQMKSGSKHD